MDWKAAAITYGSTTAKLRAMTREEYEEYREKWIDKALFRIQVKDIDGNPDPKWVGFYDALMAEDDRRANGTADTDPWLDEVLRYLYEEKEVPHA